MIDDSEDVKVEDEIEADASRPKLPNMNEFSPGTLGTKSIKQVLTVIDSAKGDRAAAIASIIAAFPKIKATAVEKQQKSRAGNVLIGMSQCGLLQLDEKGNVTAKLTELGLGIATAASEADASDRFSRHILEKLHGITLLDSVSTIRARGETLSLQSLRTELRSRTFLTTENEGNSAKLRQWLEASGVVDEDWQVDDARLHAVVGASHATLGKWASLTRAQRKFLEGVRRITLDDKEEWVPVRQVKRLCETEHGRTIFPEGHLRQEVIEPLEIAGWLETRGKGGGRGGDSGDVRATAQLLDIKLELPTDLIGGIPVDLRDKLSVPREKILKDLKSSDTHVKGVALELLALRLCRDIHLFPVGFRERSNKTQGAEVDLIADGVHLHYSRWLLQCKNTARVDMKDLAKEIGMAVLLKAHVVVLVTTGRFSKTVLDAANGLASTTGLQAVLIDGPLLEKYRTGGGNAVLEWLNTNAYHVLARKREQVKDVEE